MQYQPGDPVDLIVVRRTPLGYVVQINDQEEGLLFKNDVFQPLERGEEVKATSNKCARTEKLM